MLEKKCIFVAVEASGDLGQLLNWHVRSCWKFSAPNACCTLTCRVSSCDYGSWIKKNPIIFQLHGWHCFSLDSSRILVNIRAACSKENTLTVEVLCCIGPLMSSGGALIFPMPQSTQAMLRPSNDIEVLVARCFAEKMVCWDVLSL